MCEREAAIFVTSPGSVTPYHMDKEINFLLQIRGTKTISVFSASDREVLSESNWKGTLPARRSAATWYSTSDTRNEPQSSSSRQGTASTFDHRSALDKER